MGLQQLAPLGVPQIELVPLARRIDGVRRRAKGVRRPQHVVFRRRHGTRHVARQERLRTAGRRHDVHALRARHRGRAHRRRCRSPPDLEYVVALKTDGTLVLWGRISESPIAGVTQLYQLRAGRGARWQRLGVRFASTPRTRSPRARTGSVMGLGARTSRTAKLVSKQHHGAAYLARARPERERATRCGGRAAECRTRCFGDGTVMECGVTSQQPDPCSRVCRTSSAITAGFEHALALRNDGSVWAWGRNNKGQSWATARSMRVPAFRPAGQPRTVAGTREHRRDRGGGQPLPTPWPPTERVSGWGEQRNGNSDGARDHDAAPG